MSHKTFSFLILSLIPANPTTKRRGIWRFGEFCCDGAQAVVCDRLLGGAFCVELAFNVCTGSDIHKYSQLLAAFQSLFSQELYIAVGRRRRRC
jgi:hypothetical protein